jgi:transcriptional regulator with XRE-family HTH domain
MDRRKHLGRQIREARKSRGFTQEDLARKLSIDRSELSNYENGKVTASFHAVVEIAKALDTGFSTLDGFRIGPEHSLPNLQPLPHQLCIEFDREHTLDGAQLRIKPTKEGILISGRVERIRRA